MKMVNIAETITDVLIKIILVTLLLVFLYVKIPEIIETFKYEFLNKEKISNEMERFYERTNCDT